MSETETLTPDRIGELVGRAINRSRRATSTRHVDPFTAAQRQFMDAVARLRRRVYIGEEQQPLPTMTSIVEVLNRQLEWRPKWDFTATKADMTADQRAALERAWGEVRRYMREEHGIRYWSRPGEDDEDALPVVDEDDDTHEEA